VLVLVTGASGYVGRSVVCNLAGTGHEVRAVVRKANTAPRHGIEWVTGDLLKSDTLPRFTNDIDAIVHLAALTRVRESFQKPADYLSVNVTGTLNLLRALPGVPVVFASTASVYGAPEIQPIGEDTPLDPQNPYAASKVAAEQVVRWASAGSVVLRLFNVSGAGDPDLTRVLPKAVAVAAGQASHVDVYGDGSAIRDFVHVDDVAAAVALAVREARPGRHRVYNLGAVPATVAEIIAATERVTGRPVPVVQHEAHPGEVKEVRADTTRARTELGWQPVHSGLDSIVADQWAVTRQGPEAGGLRGPANQPIN
jgi:UDP-glucose 4-epimerase